MCDKTSILIACVRGIVAVAIVIAGVIALLNGDHYLLFAGCIFIAFLTGAVEYNNGKLSD
jgi:hypothetical protein